MKHTTSHDANRSIIQSERGNLWSALSVTLLIPLTVICTGLQIYFANSFELGILFSTVVLTAGVYLAASIVFLLGLQWLFRKNKKRFEIVNSILLGFGILLYLQANWFNWNLGKFDGDKLNFGDFRFHMYVLEPVVWISVWGLIVWFRRNICRFSVHIAYVIIAIQLTAILLPQGNTNLAENGKDAIPHNFPQYELTFKNFFDYSGHDDVYLLILDAFGSQVFENVVLDFPNYCGTTLKDFTYFPQCRGQYDTTPFAVPTILTGKRSADDDSVKMNYTEHYNESFSRPYQLFDTLAKNGYFCHVYTWRPYTLPWNPDVIKNIRETSKQPSVRTFVGFTLFRLFPTALKESSFARRTLIGSHGGVGTPCLTGIAADKYIPMITPPYDSAIYSFAGNENWRHTNIKQFKFLHLQGIHTPFYMDENGHLNLLNGKRGLQGIRSVAKGNLKNLASFIEKMKQSGAYENSLIVIMADHGINTLGTKYQPLLLVKRPNDQYETMQISDAPVHIADTTPAVLTELGLDRPKDAFSWFDIPQDILAQRKTEWNEFWKKHNIPQETTITKKLLHAEK
jgi:hypothetical protein